MISNKKSRNRKRPYSSNLFFLPSVVKPGRYGNFSGPAVILPNNAKLINIVLDLNEDTPLMILAFDAGGYDIVDTISFKSSDRQCVLRVLNSENTSGSINQPRPVNIPVSLAKALKIENNEVVGGWKINLCSDELCHFLDISIENQEDGGEISGKSINFIRRIAVRLLTGAKLFLLHLLAFVIPILIIDPSILSRVCLISVLSVVSLLLFWELYPGKGVIKGFLNSLIMGFLLWLLQEALFPVIGVWNYWLIIVVLSSSIWFSIVFSGSKWNLSFQSWL